MIMIIRKQDPLEREQRCRIRRMAREYGSLLPEEQKEYIDRWGSEFCESLLRLYHVLEESVPETGEEYRQEGKAVEEQIESEVIDVWRKTRYFDDHVSLSSVKRTSR